MRATFVEATEHDFYSRFTNTGVAELAEKLRFLEGAEAGHAVASGHHLFSCRSVFGSTHTVLTKILRSFRIGHTYIDAGDPDSWEVAIQVHLYLVRQGHPAPRPRDQSHRPRDPFPG